MGFSLLELLDFLDIVDSLSLVSDSVRHPRLANAISTTNVPAMCGTLVEKIQLRFIHCANITFCGFMFSKIRFLPNGWPGYTGMIHFTVRSSKCYRAIPGWCKGGCRNRIFLILSISFMGCLDVWFLVLSDRAIPGLCTLCPSAMVSQP